MDTDLESARLASHDLGNLIKAFRLHGKNRMTQAELANAADLKQSTVSLYERGKSKGTRENILRIAAALDLKEDQTNQLLVAGGHLPKGDLDDAVQGLMAVQFIKEIFGDPNLVRVLGPIDDDLISRIIAGWKAYGEAKQEQYRRNWQSAVDLATGASHTIKAASDLMLAYVHDTRGTALLHLGDLEEASLDLEYARELINSIELHEDQTIEKRICTYINGLVKTHLGEIERSYGNYNEAGDLFREAETCFRDIQFTDKVMWVRRKQNVVHLLVGNYPEAGSSLDECILHFQTRPLTEVRELELTKAYIARGWVHSLEGDWWGALAYRKRGLDRAISFRLPDGNKDQYLRMQGYLYYGYDCRMIGALNEAENYLNKALDISDGLKDRKERGLILLGLARVYSDKHVLGEATFRDAEKQFMLAIEENKKIRDPHRLARTYLFAGSMYLRTKEKKYEDALRYLYRAHSMFEGFGDSGNYYYLAQTIISICTVYRTQRARDQLKDIDAIIDNGIKYSDGSKLKEEGEEAVIYYQNLAKLKALRGQLASDRGDFDGAVGHYADALVDAAKFNQYLVKWVSDAIIDTLQVMGGSRHTEEVKDWTRILKDLFCGQWDDESGVLKRTDSVRYFRVDKYLPGVVNWLENLSEGASMEYTFERINLEELNQFINQHL